MMLLRVGGKPTEMLLVLVAIFFLVASVTDAIPTALFRHFSTDYDAIVVGGGPSGLAALSALARIRRRALLIDSGEYRNAPTRLMHDIIGFDGVPPPYYRWVARRQIAHYATVIATNGTVTQIEPVAEYTYFNVTMRALNGTLLSYTASKIILATGVRDFLPQTPGIQENFGKGIYWCPWCDGNEHADQAIGILGPFDLAVEASAEISTLNSNITIYVNGTDTPEMRARADKQFAKNSSMYLQRKGVKVENRTVTHVKKLRDGFNPNRDPSLPSVPEHYLFEVEFESSQKVQQDVLFQLVTSEQRSSLPKMLGVKMVDGMMAVESESMRTSVPGVWAIGDANTDKSTNVLHAAYTGKIAVVDLHMQMERESSRAMTSSLLPMSESWKQNVDREKIWARVHDTDSSNLGTNQRVLHN